MTKWKKTRPTLLLLAAGLGLNVALVWLAKGLSLPLYLDSVGTVIAAALGGFLPGIAVGFLSNCVTAALAVSPDPMTLYYGFLNVLIAAAAAFLSKRGLLLKWYGKALAVAAFSLIGGALGSVMTWVLYGFSFGQGVSAPLANLFFERMRMAQFPAQLAADLSIDLIDKVLTVGLLCAALYLTPLPLLEKFPLGPIYRARKKPPGPTAEGLEQLWQERRFRRRSVRTRVTLLIVVSTAILSLIALTISITTYRSRLMEQYSDMCADAVSMMLPKLSGDQVETYLRLGEAAPGYAEPERDLCDILHNAEKIKYMYVYSIRPDGVHVVFDLDTEGLRGEAPGTVFEFDETFPYLPQALAGEVIPPFVTNDTYGWLLTVYEPVYASDGAVAAYAAADIDMQSIRTNIYAFCISIASLLFGVMIVITAFALWYCDERLLEPMGALVEQARDFDLDGSRAGQRVRDRVRVQTGDEIEEVFSAMCRTEDAIAARVAELQAKNLEISRMQRNIIYTLASMVEDRDSGTGGHIRRTAGYVQLIGEALLSNGLFPEQLNGAYIKKLCDSAPLHDIGKVKIPDAVLNKPGRLTAEEFALMKTHTTQGAQILRSSLWDIEDGSWLSVAIDMAGCHHERWDGGGYPRGLKGGEIPLCARIMAVADVFDALISQRSYKPAFSFETALGIIRDGAGSQFDPQVAAAFLTAETAVRQVVSDAGEKRSADR